jgi:hypothetical protein
MTDTTVTIPCPDESVGRGSNLRNLHEVVLRYASADDAITAMQVLEEARRHPAMTETTGRLRRLTDLYELQDGWDSYGGKKPDITALLIAQTMTSREPTINPSGDGSVLLEWHEDGFDLEVWISPSGLHERTFTDGE